MNRNNLFFVFPALLLLPASALAQSQHSGIFSNPLFNTLLVAIILLVILIIALASVLKTIARSEIAESKFRRKNAGKTLSVIILLWACSASAQTEAQPVSTVGGMDSMTFYFMAVIIAIELLVAGVLVSLIKTYLDTGEAKVKSAVAVKKKTRMILARLTDAVEVEKEADIVLDHEYDGIRELDNNLPPWWKYGFYLTIVVAVGYMVNYHITHTAPLQAEEYQRSIEKAEAEVAEYMKKSALNVDENTVTMLTAEKDISAGKDLYIANCAICHGRSGEGGVGPNLTDEYWLYRGSVKDIFKTIKYGQPDKGMKSWKAELSPVQIAQVSSFIKTLKGTNPPNGKEKQGELFKDDEPATPPDSVKTVAALP